MGRINSCMLYGICIFKTQLESLTVSVRQAGVEANRDMKLEEDRPVDRHANGDRNVKFSFLFNTNFSTITCYILPSRTMSQLFNGVNFVYRSVEVY